MNNTNRKLDALNYHAKGRPGKIQVVPTKPTNSQRDLTMAYSPGVAEPCLKIAENVEDVYKYTAKGNLVAVISNGTAVLGLGNIGPEASKPVMEGKGLLFKIYADIDVFDLELNAKTVDEFVNIVKALEPTFGGVNLEDISAPTCFEIERRLKAEMNIPVMHDDQHGTAIVTLAGLINAVKVTGKNLDESRIVVVGAGAAGTAIIKLLNLYTKAEILAVDSKGILSVDRKDLNEEKHSLLVFTNPNNVSGSLEHALAGADVFIGVSKAGLLTPELVKEMAENPIIFAMANPEPEILPDLAKQAGAAVVATGRSDFPNQINNSLAFPGIFRGALDNGVLKITDNHKLAAAKALAALVENPTADEVVPSAFDTRVSSAVAAVILPE